MEELIPILHFYRIVRLWWVVVLAALLGGAAGYGVFRLRPPLYEATAVFYVTIDFDKVAGGPLSQYDEDLALSVMQKGLLYSPSLHERIVKSPAFRPTGLTYKTWIESITLERQHAFWKARVRHTDPEIARILVNQWAEFGYQDLMSMREEGSIPDYIVIEPPVLADKPYETTNYGMNQMVLAGSLVGFIIALFLSSWLASRVGSVDENADMPIAS
jgi:hypothetical protein